MARSSKSRNSAVFTIGMNGSQREIKADGLLANHRCCNSALPSTSFSMPARFVGVCCRRENLAEQKWGCGHDPRFLQRWVRREDSIAIPLPHTPHPRSERARIGYSGNSHYTSRGWVTHKRVASAASAQQGDQNNQFLHGCPL